MDSLNQCFKSQKGFEKAVRDFEAERGCYLPFATCLVKPCFHIRSLSALFDRKSECRQSV